MSRRAERNKPTVGAGEAKSRGYRGDYIRRRLLLKSFKGDEKGYKTLLKLPETVLSGMEVLWRQKILCDIELITADRKRICAHRLVLVTCSDYFYEEFIEAPSGALQIEVPDIRGATLEVMIDAMYTGKVKVESDNVDDLMLSASSMGMFMLLDACEDFLLEHLGKDNCLQLLGTAFKHGLSRLTEAALEIAAHNFNSISKKLLFRNLPIEHVAPLLKRNDLKVENELEAFYRARAWIDEDKPCRLQHAAEVLSNIRLPLLTPAEVIDNIESCAYLMEIVECQRLVKEALHYHLMPSRQCLLQTPRTVPRLHATECLVVTGGAPRLETDHVRDHVLSFDHVTGKWNQLTKIPAPRHHHAAIVLNGFMYIVGGDETNDVIAPTRTMFRFDPRNGSWIEVAHMLYSRQSFNVAVLNNTIYAIGGRVSHDECLSSVERYDPSSDTWQEVKELNGPRRCAAVACLNGKLYAVGGSGSKALSSRVERYSPAENKWEILKPLSIPRFYAHLCPISGHLYLVGGATIDAAEKIVCTDTIERYSPMMNQWTFVCRMTQPRSEFGSAVIGDKIYVIGGYDWTVCKRLVDVECFDTGTGNWSHVSEMSENLVGSAACALVLYQPK